MLQASSQYNVLVGAAVVATTDLIQEADLAGLARQAPASVTPIAELDLPVIAELQRDAEVVLA
jgi:hypothetical protein